MLNLIELIIHIWFVILHHISAVEEVSTRFLKDVQFAKSKGVNLKDLLKALDDQKAKRHAHTEEERQLQGLLKSKRDISEENLANVAM